MTLTESDKETEEADNGAGHQLAGQVANSNNNNAPRLNNMRRLLVRQLTSLIMNHEPESIAEYMEGAKISGQMVSESALEDNTLEAAKVDSENNLGTNSKGGDDDANVRGSPVAIGQLSESADNETFESTQEISSTGVASNGVGGDQGELFTCQPDDLEAPPYEAFGNLTSEQQQQLFADSSGLLPTSGNSSTNENANQSTTQTTAAAAATAAATTNRSPGNPICVHSGSHQMIEFITKVLTPILFGIIIVVGLLGNIIVMLVILEDRKTERELTPTNLLILDLSLADLSFIIFCIPFTGWDYSVGHWVFGQLWCKFNQYLIVVCALSSIYTLVLMSVDRFMAIVYPIECISYRTSKNTLYAIYIKWILILLIASPTVSMHGLVELPFGEPDQFNCRFLADQYNPLHFQIAFFITSYLFPLILIFCLYLSLLNKLWFGSKPHGHKESHKMLESKKKVTWLVAGIVVVFALCWCPIQVMLIMMRLKYPSRITATYVAIQVFAHILGYMNSCVNPIVYAFASETFHNSFKRSSFGRFLCHLCCCSNGQPDRDRSHSNANRLETIQTTNHNNNNNTVTISLNQNNNLTNQQRRLQQLQQQQLHRYPTNHVQTSKNGSLGDDNNNLSTTTLLITPYNSYHNSEKSNKTVTLPLEPRDRDLPLPTTPLSNSNKSLDDFKTTQVRETMANAGGSGSSSQQNTVNIEAAGFTSSALTPAKQQLVAHVAQSGNQVSHRCEPCYFQE